VTSSWFFIRQLLNGLVRFAERLTLVSARVPSHFNWPVTLILYRTYNILCINRLALWIMLRNAAFLECVWPL